MATGTVKWFSSTKGFGFIQPNPSPQVSVMAGKGEVFVHITTVQAAGLTCLNEGQKVSFDLTMERGKAAASNLKPI